MATIPLLFAGAGGAGVVFPTTNFTGILSFLSLGFFFALGFNFYRVAPRKITCGGVGELCEFMVEFVDVVGKPSVVSGPAILHQLNTAIAKKEKRMINKDTSTTSQHNI